MTWSKKREEIKLTSSEKNAINHTKKIVKGQKYKTERKRKTYGKEERKRKTPALKDDIAQTFNVYFPR